MSKLDVPTLIFHADNDARVPISEGRFLAANIKNSKYQEDTSPLDLNCKIRGLSQYSKSYLNHLTFLKS